MFGTGYDIDCEIKEELLPSLLDGRKTVEIRLYKDKWMKVVHGSLLRVNKKHIFLVGVIRYWDNFSTALVDCGFKKAVPQSESFNDAVKFYETIYGDESDLKECVMTMQLKLLGPSR